MNPVWKENLVLHCSIKDTLFVEVWDEDKISKDDLMETAKYTLSTLDLQSGKDSNIEMKVKNGHITFVLSFTSLSH